MYVKNEALTDLLDNINSAVYVEQQEAKRGNGSGEDYMRRLRKQQHDLRELEVAWMTLQDLVKLEDRTLEGLRSGAPTANEWKAVFDRARELFEAKGSEAALTKGSTGSDDALG